LVYYNENDPYAAAWLRNLIAGGHLPPDTVDERDVRNVRADEVRRYDQCHWFAGIGGWPYALELAGWPPARPVWTGSCPCQPFSAVGKRQGAGDDRHLWPVWFELIRQCRPPVIFGEQVASAIGYGWLDGVCADLEREGYAVGAAVLPASSVGAPHIRQRLFWVADGVGDTDRARSQGCGHVGERTDQLSAWAASKLIWCRDGKWRRIPAEPRLQPLADGLSGGRVGKLRAAGNAIVPLLAAAFIRAACLT
jgi:DNA (cytosine-5)-methyltransferase 1